MAHTSPLRVAVMISGRGSNMQRLIESARQHLLPVEFVLVLSDKASAPGVGIAERLGVCTKVVPRRKSERSLESFTQELIAELRAVNAQLVVLAGFMRVLSPEFIAAFAGRIINIHPSLLPSFPGLEAQRQALDAGAGFAGCTVHYVTEEVDGGPIIAQAVVPVCDDDDLSRLSERILALEHKLLPAVVGGISRGEIALEGGKVKVASGLRSTHTVRLNSELAAMMNIRPLD